MGFVLVQHLAPVHPSNLAAILSRATRMPVSEVADAPAVEPNHVYVIPPGRNMMISKGKLQLLPREGHGPHRPVDIFLRTLAQDRGHKAIGVILSGTSTDGTIGLEEVKAEGGITFAQDSTAQYEGMPRSAADTGCVDSVLPPAEIASELARIARHPYVSPAERIEETALEPGIGAILRLLQNATNVDFRQYKSTTVFRRIARRMVLHNMEGLQEYGQFLRGNPQEVVSLYHDILISVTSFFRNPEVFEALKTTVYPKLFQDRSPGRPLRVWVLGCSTGEEAYSIAITFVEFIGAAGVVVPVQIFATDLNGKAIEKARTGIYGRNIADEVSPDRLRRFFTEFDGGYRINKAIRDMCVFAQHNVLADPPFSKIDLVACRNLLIYLESAQQQKVLPLLHYALRPDGYLVLGSSETIGSRRQLFAAENAQHRIYAKKPGSSRLTLNLVAKGHPTVPADFSIAPGRSRPAIGQVVGGSEVLREADRILLARYVPPAVLVNADLDIVHFRGDTGPYLAPPSGNATLNLFKMAREGLLMALRSAIIRARKDDTAVRDEGLRIKSHDGIRKVNLEVVPVRGPSTKEIGFLVLFEEPSEAGPRRRRIDRRKTKGTMKTGRFDQEISRLSQELDATREYLQSVIEQQEAANEELQSANEEVQSSNEELQSTNEELATSKEEIQSSNEELTTVNDELRNRNIDLGQLNNDFMNLFASVEMTIVIVGRDLRIRRFTTQAEETLGLDLTDIGRSIGDGRLARIVPDIEDRLTRAIDSGISSHHEVQDSQGRWHVLRVHPNKAVDNRIDGAVVLMVDVDDLKLANADLIAADRRRNQFLAMLAHELRNPLAPLRNAVQVLNTRVAGQADVEHARGMLERNVATMSRMIEDMLDASRITQGKIQLRLEPVELAVVLARAVSTIRPDVGTHDQKVEISIPSLPVYVNADPTRLEQVFANLLNNASKFGHRGGHIWLGAGAPSDGKVVIRVRDDGIGIPPDLLRSVFDLFMQADDSLERTRSGLGIGLTLVRNLLELHDGTVEAHSAGNGKGSEFIVRLPVIPSPVMENPRAGAGDVGDGSEAPGSGSKRILVVDDNLDSAESLATLLRIRGNEVMTAADGPGALKAAATFRPEVVLLDVGLPGMDGYEVARQMRQQPATRRALLIALTGYGRIEDREAALKAGFDKHFTKPIDPKTLYQYVAQVAS